MEMSVLGAETVGKVGTLGMIQDQTALRGTHLQGGATSKKLLGWVPGGFQSRLGALRDGGGR